MRMKRDIYKIEKEKQVKFRAKLADDGMSFAEFLDRIVYMYLKEKYTFDSQ